MKTITVMPCKRSRRNQKGSAMVEFALGSTMLLLFLFGVADFGRLFYDAIEVANAAAAGASYGSFKSANLTDTTGISTAAKNEALEISDLKVDSSEVCQDDNGASALCNASGAYQYVKVTTSHTFQTLVKYPLIPASVKLSTTVMMRGK